MTTQPYRVLLRSGADRATWLAERRRGLGGSDAPAVLGWGGHSTPLEVYTSKVTDLDRDDLDDNEYVAWGRILEDVIAREWARREGKRIRRGPALVQSTRWPWMLASVDRLVLAPSGNKPVAIVECKNRSNWVSRDWEDELPSDVTAQVLHYLAVYGLHRGYVACLVGGNQLRTFTVDADDALLTELAEAEREWWDSYVVPRALPPLTASPSNARELARLHPNPDGVVAMDSDGVDLLRRRRKAAEVAKAAAAEVDSLDDEVRLLLADRVEGHIGGVKFVQWKPGAGQRSCDYDRLHAEFPDAYAACVTEGQPVRRLTYSKKELPS